MRSLMKEARQRERAVVVNILRKADIVLSTCVGAGSRLLQDLQFDMVVIDEAAQGLEAACWIPILKINSRTGGKCVLAGKIALSKCPTHNHFQGFDQYFLTDECFTIN
jgi:DNA polymerase alpha-associated DNA helicase A